MHLCSILEHLSRVEVEIGQARHLMYSVQELHVGKLHGKQLN